METVVACMCSVARLTGNGPRLHLDARLGITKTRPGLSGQHNNALSRPRSGTQLPIRSDRHETERSNFSSTLGSYSLTRSRVCLLWELYQTHGYSVGAAVGLAVTTPL
jgi:hypothetical protein